MYDNGHGVPQNYAEAVKWYRLAAEQGYGSPQYNLGQMYQFGRGVPQNGAEAVKWYRLAARQGHTKSQLNLGGIYNSGEGVLQVNQTAHMWYNIGAANGNVLGGTLRELVALNMTPTSIEEAQRRARVCMESNYQDCD